MAEGEAGSDGRSKVIVQRANLYLNARKELLASLGALALTLEESNDFIDLLVTRGTLVEADLQKLLGGDCGTVEQKKVESLLNDFNTSAPSEIESLSQRISLLAQKINTLVDQRHQQRSREL